MAGSPPRRQARARAYELLNGTIEVPDPHSTRISTTSITVNVLLVMALLTLVVRRWVS